MNWSSKRDAMAKIALNGRVLRQKWEEATNLSWHSSTKQRMISSINTHRMNCKNCKKTKSSSSTGWLCSSTRIQWMDRREGSGFGSRSTEWWCNWICIEWIETKQRSCNGSSSTGRSCTSICILWIERRLRSCQCFIATERGGNSLYVTSNNYTTR